MKNITKRNFFKGLALLTLNSYLIGKSSNLLAHSKKKDDYKKSNFGNDTDALIVVDVQNDFCPGGSLAVKEGNTIIGKINEIQMFLEVIDTVLCVAFCTGRGFRTDQPRKSAQQHQ